MAAVTIRAGMTVDIPSRDEIAQITGESSRAALDHYRAQEREHSRAIKKLRRSTLLSTPAGTRPTVLDNITPAAGDSWVVRIIGVTLASAGTGAAYITSDSTATLGLLTQSRPVASFTTSGTTQVELLNAGACILDVDEGLYLNFTQNIVGYMIAGWMAPTEMVYKLY